MVALVTSLGVIAVLAGLGAILFGIPINEFGIGNTLILAGTTAASAGFIVLALAAVLRAILQMGGEATVAEEPEEMPAERRAAASEWPRPAPIAAARAENQARERAEPPPAARPPWLGARGETLRDEPRAPPPRAAPPLRGERSPPPTARPPLRAERAAERPVEPPAPRASFQAPEPSPAEEPMAPAPEFGRDAATEPPPQPERRRFFAWTRRSSGRETAEPTSEPRAEPSLGEGAPRFEPARRTGRGEPLEDQPELARASAEPPPPRQAEEGSADQVEVLKSGTVGGMAYTLYTDGSIDAEFVEGKIRFASIDELRRHLEERG